MGRMYTIPLVRTAVTAAVDLCEILTPASVVVWVHQIELSQSTEVADAAEEQLQLAWKVGQTTSGSGGNTGVTPAKTLPGDAASTLTVESFNTTKASAGTIVTQRVWDWNIRVPFDKVLTPETRLFIPPSTRVTLELVGAPADSVTIGGQITVEEVG